MVEDNEMTRGYEGQGIRAALWSAFGVGTAAAAKYVLGGEGGLFGGGCNKNVATTRDLDYERKLTEANAKIGQLEAEQFASAAALATERRLADKIEALEKAMNATAATQAVLNAKQEAFIGGLAAQVASFDRMTARYIIQPVMSASEAAAAAFAPKATTATGTGS